MAEHLALIPALGLLLIGLVIGLVIELGTALLGNLAEPYQLALKFTTMITGMFSIRRENDLEGTTPH